MYFKAPKHFIAGITTLSVLTCMMLTGCTKVSREGPGDEPIKGSISVSGAFALYPLAVQWGNEFQEANPGIRVDISAGGAGKGMTDVINGMVDFAMMSRDIYDEERAQGAVDFIVGRDAVVADINAANPLLDEIISRGITAEDATKFWVTGEYKTWGDFLGNGDTHPVHVYTRSDACGAAQTWAAWFGATQEDLGGTAVYGDPGIAKAVQDDIWGIGFNNMAYAYDAATHKPLERLVIPPVDLNEDGVVSPDEYFYDFKEDLIEAIKKDLYPVPPCRNLYLVSKGIPRDSAAIAFLRYIITEGQTLNEPAGYVSIGEEAFNRSEGILRSGEGNHRLKQNTTDRIVTLFIGIILFFLLVSSGSLLFKTRTGKRVYRQRLSEITMFILIVISLLFLVAMIVGLLVKALPILQQNTLWSLVSSSEWKPSQGKFGFKPFIMGSIAVTALSILIATPIALLTAVYLSEYAPKAVCKVVYPALDILASIPSVIYGVWGVLLLIPIWGYSLITASVVLFVMVLPIMVSLFVELFNVVSKDLRDASLSLGATPWQTTRKVVIRKALPGLFATVVLAVSKAIGETIAVMMVCGAITAVPTSLFEGFNTLPALIGNNYGEMASIPLYESAIMFAALILLIMVIMFNIISRVVLYRIEKRNK